MGASRLALQLSLKLLNVDQGIFEVIDDSKCRQIGLSSVSSGADRVPPLGAAASPGEDE
ncbi:MAG: hypothetical protein Q7P63_01360 [Verrucomicrobiota bacterium JB022]|nr:hypothetical protein [Verrucomicrobiota bacterium JB022]